MIQQGQPPMQGYNAQAAVTTGQIIVAAEVATSRAGLRAAGTGRPTRRCAICVGPG